MKSIANSTTFAALVQAFFCHRLIEQQNASQQTVAAYRDTFRLLLGYLQDERGISPEQITLAALDADTIAAFLDHLESERHNCIRTRNARFAAIRAFFKFAAARDPQSLPSIQRVLAIPSKRFARPAMCSLTREEMLALLASCNRANWTGQRDHILLSLMYNTGARVSEAVAIRRKDVFLTASCSVKISGKGRKQRMIPLWKTSADYLRKWLERIDSSPDAPLFPGRDGKALSRSAVEKRLQRVIARTIGKCPTLKNKNVSPHTIRHTTAMHLLQAGVDLSVISIWLGHESIETTHHYVEANLAMKELALAKMEAVPVSRMRFQPRERLLQFLDAL
jgi:site-specific recombinase XerD